MRLLDGVEVSEAAYWKHIEKTKAAWRQRQIRKPFLEKLRDLAVMQQRRYAIERAMGAKSPTKPWPALVPLLLPRRQPKTS